MAQRVSIDLVCDFCEDQLGAGADVAATEAFTVSISGPEYALDLCDDHAKGFYELRDLVHRVGRTERAKPRPYNPDTRDRKRARSQQLQRVRAWARNNGYQMGNARVPYAIQRAYNDAHPEDVVALADRGRGTTRGSS